MVLSVISLLSTTEYNQLKEYVKNLKTGDELVNELERSLVEKFSQKGFFAISFQFIKKMQQKCDCCIHHLIPPSSFQIVDLREPPKKNPELEKRLEKLRRAEEQRQYDELVGNVCKPSDSAGVNNIGTECLLSSLYHSRLSLFFFNLVKSLDRQIIGFVNFVLTVAGAVMFGYKAPELLWGYTEVQPVIYYLCFL